jgi:predicted Fe-Mo cluster-binding NifX family protein
MLLAIPILNGRVSPVFDTACRLVLVDVDRGNERARRTEEFSETFPLRRVRGLQALGVAVLICGGISRPLATMLAAAGIQVIPWIAGPVDDIVRVYLEGRLPQPQWMMPGCFCHQHGRQGQGGAGRRGGRGPRV